MIRGRSGEAGRFLSVGVVNTLVGLMVIYAAKWFFHLGDVAANVVGYSIGLAVSFTLNSRWTFDYRGPMRPAFGKFVFVSLLAYGMNLVTVMSSISYLELSGYIAHALGVVPYTMTCYFSSKYLVFGTHHR